METARELNLRVQSVSYLFPPMRITGSSEAPDRMPLEEAAHFEAVRLGELNTPEQSATYQKLLAALGNDSESCAHCRAGRSTFWLRWDGKLSCCGMVPEPSADALALGFSASWQKLNRMIREIHHPQECAHCRYRNICRNCLTRCYSETGRFDVVPAYPCRMTKAMVKELGIE